MNDERQEGGAVKSEPHHLKWNTRIQTEVHLKDGVHIPAKPFTMRISIAYKRYFHLLAYCSQFNFIFSQPLKKSTGSLPLYVSEVLL